MQLAGTGFLEGYIPAGNASAASLAESLGCNLSLLDLHGNALSGTVPLQLANLSQLYSLDLAYNQFTGTVPAEELGSLTALKYVYLSGNLLSGVVAPGLCQLGRNSSITDLVIKGNILNGTLDVSKCVNLFFLDASVGTTHTHAPNLHAWLRWPAIPPACIRGD